MTTKELKIEGMSCSHCSAAVARALESVNGVVRARVDLAGGTATVEGDASVDRLVAAVVAEGYRAAPLGS
jgi:copper chaperone